MIVVFDLDGTLIDSSKRHVAVLTDILRTRLDVMPEELNLFLDYKKDGNSTMQFLTNILNFSDKEAKEISQEWSEKIEYEEYVEMDCLYPEVMRILKKLQKKCIIYYLTARREKETLYRELERLQINEFSKEVLVVDPFNAIEQKIQKIQELTTDAKQILLIGDTEVEYHVAKNQNIAVKLLHRGFRSEKYWQKKNVETTYENLSEMFIEEENYD